jgi:hypothetical protein
VLDTLLPVDMGSLLAADAAGVLLAGKFLVVDAAGTLLVARRHCQPDTRLESQVEQLAVDCSVGVAYPYSTCMKMLLCAPTDITEVAKPPISW